MVGRFKSGVGKTTGREFKDASGWHGESREQKTEYQGRGLIGKEKKIVGTKGWERGLVPSGIGGASWKRAESWVECQTFEHILRGEQL